MVDLRLSKSKIMDYVVCPRMFYFRYCTTFGKTRQQASPELERGSILHEIYEAFNTNEENYIRYCDFVEDNEDYGVNLKGFHQILDQYGLFRAKYSELNIYNAEWNLTGIVDAIYVTLPDGEEDAEYWLIDYKTGKYHAKSQDNYMMELYIYEYITNKFLNDMHGTTDVAYIDRVGMFFTSDPKKSFVVKVDDERQKIGKKEYAGRIECMDRIHEIMDKIKNDDFEKPGQMCKWCQFASICDDYTDNILKRLNDHVLMVV